MSNKQDYPEAWKDGKRHNVEGKEFVKWTGGGWETGLSDSDSGVKNDNINIVLDRTQIEKDLQEKYETEHDNATKLKQTVEKLIGNKLQSGELSAKDIPSYLLDEVRKFDKAHPEFSGDSKHGGGLVKLENYGKSAQDFTYSTMAEGVTDLYERTKKGDVEAKKKLNELKSMAIDDLKMRSIKGENFYMVRCVSCGNMVDVSKLSGSMKCPNCEAKLGVS